MTRFDARAGFTMMEMIIVIVIFSVLALTVLPNISKMTVHGRVNQAAKVVARDLSVAASNAARERKPMRIASISGPAITITDRVSNTVLSTRFLGPKDAYRLDSVSFSVTPVDIFPNGYTSSALTITLWAGGYSRQVTMSKAGWVRTK